MDTQTYVESKLRMSERTRKIVEAIRIRAAIQGDYDQRQWGDLVPSIVWALQHYPPKRAIDAK